MLILVPQPPPLSLSVPACNTAQVWGLPHLNPCCGAGEEAARQGWAQWWYSHCCLPSVPQGAATAV